MRVPIGGALTWLKTKQTITDMICSKGCTNTRVARLVIALAGWRRMAAGVGCSVIVLCSNDEVETHDAMRFAPFGAIARFEPFRNMNEV